MSKAKTICTVCNYIYDEAMGEPRLEISPALKFEDLPDEWACPECGSAKDMFQPCSCVSLPIYEQTCVVHHHDTNPNNTLAATAEGALSKSAPVGQLVAQRPLRACVLEQYGIDYCCGGKATLEEACQKKGLQVEEILEKLLAADRKGAQSADTDWTTASLKDLIDHIVNTYHQPLRQELSRVVQLAEKVARVHGDNHPEMVEVMNIFNRFKAQLELHMQKEEMVLFPGIASMEATGTPQIFGCGGGIEHPIDVMNQEHDEAGEALSAMRRLTNDYTPPDDACSSFKLLLSSLAQIESEMHQHVHKENNILFPRALELRKPALTSR
ncbi:MAG: iron-sulfur cluster repair di-iron protein [Candidatus Obscuribacterales bacterium]|nr:iron-sulfur cluster repair di-iron protein [Candidatus Obscuribacterales bacterium]